MSLRRDGRAPGSTGVIQVVVRVDRVNGEEERFGILGLGRVIDPGHGLVRQEIGGVQSRVRLGLLHVVLESGVQVLVGSRLDHEVVAGKTHVLEAILVGDDVVEVHQLAGEVGLVAGFLEHHRQPLLVVSLLDELGVTTYLLSVFCSWLVNALRSHRKEDEDR